MGATNHGTQTISHRYYEDIKALYRNERFTGVLPTGFYSGGKLAKVSDEEVTISPLVAQIGDGTSQITVRTASPITVNDSSLDSGSISSSNGYIVLRWAHVDNPSNYVEVHAVASASANDLVVGKIVFWAGSIVGFEYENRTFTNVQSLFLKPETSDGLYILINAGKVHTTSAYAFVDMQEVGPFSVPGSPYSRIDLVYIDSDGYVQIHEGDAAVFPVPPDYGGRLVIAEVTVVNGDTSISSSHIKDVRSFVHLPIPPSNVVPAWRVSVADANNLTHPDDFTEVIAAFKLPSFGSITGTQDHCSEYWMYNNSVRYRMGVDVVSSVTKTLKLFAVDNKIYVYVDSSLVYSYTSAWNSPNSPKTVNINLTAGPHTIDVVFSDQGGNAYLNLMGDIIDNSTVLYRSI